MKKSIFAIFLAVTAATTVAPVYGAAVYETHADIYKAMTSERFQERPSQADSYVSVRKDCQRGGLCSPACRNMPSVRCNTSLRYAFESRSR